MSKLKQIKGMDKFLERQYKGMADREELKLMKHNFGKISEHQKTVDQVIKPNFAYQDVEPAYDVPRISKLN